MRRDFPLDAPLHELCCDRQPVDAEALRFAWATGRPQGFSFGTFQTASRRLAEHLAERGVGLGMAVAVVLPQCPLAPAVHLALSRLGAIGVPLSPMFGPDGLAPRLAASGAVLAVAHHARAAAVREAAPSLPLASTESGALGSLTDIPPAAGAAPAWAAEALAAPRAGDRPMALLFTSGTTAQPKAALLPHRVVPGRMPGVLAAHPGFPQEGDRFWSPADWAWIGGLYDALFAPWAAGVPVFAHERHGGFDPALADRLLRANDVRNAFLPPTALRLWMRSGAPAPPLRTLHTAGEPLPEPVRAWAAQVFGTPPREVYGLTECAYLVVNAEAEPGVTGAAAPGHELAVVREDGSPCKEGEEGELAVREGSPTMMLGYAAGGRVRLPLDRGWLRTGDVAVQDESGRLTVLGRLDDVVKVSGYRVAPREVEQELMRHPAVEECAVVGVPDELRGHALRAFVRPATGARPGEALAEELRAFVRDRLAAHEVPRDVRFVAALPTTASGKVRRRELRRAG